VKRILKDFRNNISKGNKDNSTDGSGTGNKTEITRLVKEAVKGNFEAFGQLYRLLVKQIYQYVFYQVGDRMTAEDITADVFLKALERIDSCEGKESTFQAWLYRIAHNCVVDYFRRRRRHLSLENDIGDLKQEPDQSLERRELLRVTAELPRNQRQVIILKFIAGLGNAEIGNIMGKSEGAIRILQMRALALLRKKLGREQHNNG
jgi:RNA polymerase sigma-70 factor (ECF subfamily)